MGMSLALSSVRLDPLYNIIATLYGSAEVALPLTHSAIPRVGDLTPSFTRAGSKYHPDFEGRMYASISGEWPFRHVRRVRNLFSASQSFDNAAWTKFRSSITADAIAAPDGTLTADKFVEDSSAATTHFMQQNTVGTVGATEVVSIYAKAAERSWIYLQLGSSNYVYFDVANGVVGTMTGTGTALITDEGDGWYRCSLKAVRAGSQINYVMTASGDNGISYTGDGASGVYLWGAQLEDVTGQSVQTASEYVSVGALDYRSTQNPLYLSLPGTAGHGAQTPDAAANSVAGDIDIRVQAAISDYSPAAVQTLVSKWPAAPNLEYLFRIGTDGKLYFFTSPDGTTARTNTSTVALSTLSYADGAKVNFRVTKSVSSGVVTFYTSSDGVTWNQFGDPVSGTAEATYAAGTAVLEIGNNTVGAQPATGKFFSAQIYNTLGGATPVVDFNPHRDAVTPTGTITSSTTGEVWTINGASSVVRSAAYHGSMVDGVKCFATDYSGNPLPTSDSATYPMLGSYIEPAATNLCTKSQEFDVWSTSTAGAGSLPVVTANAGVAPDGTTTADKVVFDAPAAGDISALASPAFATVAASTYTSAVFIKAFAAGDVGKQILTRQAGASGYTAKTITADWQRIGTTEVAGGASNTFDILLRPTIGGSTGTVSVYLWGAQVELGSTATSYIPTTTIAVTRPADVASYTGADVANIKTLAATFRRESGVATDSVVTALSDGSTNNYINFRLDTATQLRITGVSATVGQWNQITSNTYTPASSGKASQSFATNDVKMDFNGTAQTADTSATVPSVTQMNVGHVAGILQLNGCVKNIYGWTTNKSQSELSAVDR